MYLQTNMQKVCSNAYQQYVKSRPGASVESIRRTKELRINEAGILPQYSDVPSAAMDIISRMKNYRPQGVSVTFCTDIVMLYVNFNFSIFLEIDGI